MAVFVCLPFVDLSWVVLWCSKFDTLRAWVRSKVHNITAVLITVYKQTRTTKRRDHLDDLSVVVMWGGARGWGKSGAFASGGKSKYLK
jgi:hypothetical protein